MVLSKFNKSLDNLRILIDTREQETEELKRRKSFFNDFRRQKLDYGDYSVEYEDLEGNQVDLSKEVVIERKMSIDELALCLGKDRARFTKEFERAKTDGCKVYLLIENASWESIYNHKYRSRLNEKSIIASLLAWVPRYNMVPIFCKEETSGKLIHEILYREVKERLDRALVKE